MKINGYRIELSEIEAHIEQLPFISSVAAVPVLENSLLACAVTLDKNAGISEDETASRIKEELTHSLPAYMIPEIITVMDKLPVSANGKIDRRTLAKELSGARALYPHCRRLAGGRPKSSQKTTTYRQTNL